MLCAYQIPLSIYRPSAAISALFLLCLLTACRQPANDPRLLIGGPGDQRSPTWMPDGKRIVCSSAADGFPADLYLCNPANGTSYPLTGDPSGDNSPAVSPNGRWLLFHSDRGGQSDLYCLDLATSETVRLTTNPANDSFGAWSPDSQRIVFHSEGAGDPDLWLMDRNGENKIPLVMRPGVETTAAWSPNGRAIAFSSEAGGNPDIWLVYLDDRRSVHLTNSSEAEWKPVWSPDGRRIAYCRGPTKGGHSTLWIMNTDGSDQRPLTPRGKWDDFDPAWSPDGRIIAFESNRNGDFDIWSVEPKQ